MVTRYFPLGPSFLTDSGRELLSCAAAVLQCHRSALYSGRRWSPLRLATAAVLSPQNPPPPARSPRSQSLMGPLTEARPGLRGGPTRGDTAPSQRAGAGRRRVWGLPLGAGHCGLPASLSAAGGLQRRRGVTQAADPPFAPLSLPTPW